MSARGFLVFTYAVIHALAASVAASEPALRSQADDAVEHPSAAQPSAVQDAMRHLFTMPRPGSAAARNDRQRGAKADSARIAQREATPPTNAATRPAGWAPAPSQVPLTCLDTPWFQRRGNRLPQHERDFANYRYFGGLPRAYGYGLGDYGFNDPYGDVYRFGFLEGYDFSRFYYESNARTESNLAHAATHLDRGLILFRGGHYPEAADAFRLAAETNQRDPAARLYSAHALFALGRYQEAVTYLRRAFQLQSRIIYLNFDVRDDYGRRGDFDEQVQALEKATAQVPTNVDRLLLLGYLRYYTRQRDRAYEVLARARAIDPRDALVGQLLENSRPPDVRLDRPARSK